MVAGVPGFQDRSFSDWDIGPDQSRQKIERGFVHKNQDAMLQ